jgi:hypothetical protein
MGQFLGVLVRHVGSLLGWMKWKIKFRQKIRAKIGWSIGFPHNDTGASGVPAAL